MKWLLVDFVLVGGTGECGEWELRGDAGPRVEAHPFPLRVAESRRHILVETGAAEFQCDRTVLGPVSQAVIGGVPILDPDGVRTILVDAEGRAGRPRIERLEVEDCGPVRATLRFEGEFDGRVPCRFLARVSFFAGTALVRVRLTLHNPNRARHRGGLWDLGDPGSILFRDLSMELGLGGPGRGRIAWSAEADHPPRAGEDAAFEIYQDSSGGENWSSKNHVNRHGRVPCAFRGYRVRTATEESKGLRASPVVSVQGAGGVVTAAIPEFWQQFPKAIEFRGACLGLRLFPRQFDDLFELQGGEQKTHDIWLHFGSDDRPTLAPLVWVHRPARARAAATWYADSGAVPYLDPARPEDPIESLLNGVVEGDRSFIARREIVDEFGWRHYGDMHADHEEAYYRGVRPAISHYNNQYDLLFGIIYMLLKTGDLRWFELASPLARHVVDIDIYRTDRDRAIYNGGLFWHTDHYRDAATCTHRSYSRANCRPGDRSYGGGPCNEHNYTTGLLHYYYLTGDPDARDAVILLADWVVNMDDGRKNILGFLDGGPTGAASRTTEAGYHGPGRGCGNSINALIDGWLATQDRAYLEKAEGLIRRSSHPAEDVTSRGLLDVESRWSYTVFLMALIRYLQLEGTSGERPPCYHYAVATLMNYAGWMLENESPYFDSPEKLEYPTETWAAQEFRKANVLRCASDYEDEPRRSALWRRGTEFSERARLDLMRFETRDSTRAIALLLVEGTRDIYLRSRSVASGRISSRASDFGVPEVFVSQKQRVLSRFGLQGILSGFGLWRRARGPSSAASDGAAPGAHADVGLRPEIEQ